MHDSFKALMPLIIPAGVSNYFERTHYPKDDQRLDIFLEEMNVIPEECQGNKLVSKGFFDAITPARFPYPWATGAPACQTPQMAEPRYRQGGL